MEEFRIILLCFGAVFTFALGLAWLIPLVIAGHKGLKPTEHDESLAIFDMLLLLFDSIPIFWLFRAIPQAPSAYRSIRQTWKKEASIRNMFWLWSATLASTIGAIFIPS